MQAERVQTSPAVAKASAWGYKAQAQDSKAKLRMIAARKRTSQGAIESTINRRLVDLRHVAEISKRTRQPPLEICRQIIERRVTDLKTRAFFAGLPEEEKHYWISSLYALLMPKARRRKLAAYFTPPHLAEYAIDRMVEAGVQIGQDRILDPASGGAAFLLPLATRIVDQALQRRESAKATLRRIEATLYGVEVDRDLSALSKVLLCDMLNRHLPTLRCKPNVSVKQRDTLTLESPEPLFDAVIGNPPYGRIFRPSKKTLEKFAAIISDGYVNLYALFLDQSLRFTKPGGIIVLVVPMSFLGGPYFANLRKRILETADVISLDPVDKRSDVFLDVLYDVCVLTLRKKDGIRAIPIPTCSLLTTEQPYRLVGNLELPKGSTDAVWALPDVEKSGHLFRSGLETLRDYGYIARTGYFVWNREQERYRTGRAPRPNEVPLFWAHNVKRKAICRPYDREADSEKIGFVKFDRDSSAIIRDDAIILQRTTNRRQNRRLIAGIARQSRVPGNRGFVTENHTITVVRDRTKPQLVSLSVLCRLLNTAAVDARFRRISGSVSVSTKALNQLPLPAAKHVRASFVPGSEDEQAAVLSYANSIAVAPHPTKPPAGK